MALAPTKPWPLSIISINKAAETSLNFAKCTHFTNHNSVYIYICFIGEFIDPSIINSSIDDAKWSTFWLYSRTFLTHFNILWDHSRMNNQQFSTQQWRLYIISTLVSSVKARFYDSNTSWWWRKIASVYRKSSWNKKKRLLWAIIVFFFFVKGCFILIC